MNIESYIEQFTSLWEQAIIEFPFTGNGVSAFEKSNNEKSMIAFSGNLRKEVDIKGMDKEAKNRLVQQVNSNVGAFLKNALKYTDHEIAIISKTDFLEGTKKFMAMARRFDPLVKIEDVFQASRNLWIVNSLQIMLGQKVEVTPSVFAYSMLYPYSDNYLDDQAVSKSEKIAFSNRFRLKLMGEMVCPINDREKTIFDLVEMIESDWDRNCYPEVYESLLAIHDAQTRSIILLDNKEDLSEKELLSICIEKGGTSVLADGYLINGKLTPEQECFCFGFGTFLQFVDDIQDIQEDSTTGLETLFTRSATSGTLEKDVNRTISFAHHVLQDVCCFPADHLAHMQGLMIKSIHFLIIEAVGLNDKWFSAGYVRQFEKQAALSYDFIKQRRNRLESKRLSFMRKIESMVFEELEVA